MNAQTTISVAERVTHFLTLICIGSLLAVYGLPRLAHDAIPLWPGGLAVLLLQTAPLLACVPGVLRWQRTAFGVLSLLALVYFALAIWTLMDPAQKWAGIAEVGFSLGLFFSSATFLRIQGRRMAQEAAGSDSGHDLPEQDA
ncbi:MAG: DUF2069 domain-containing protein [Gammaproteobacteria bacterium]|nr:DUF2069 domain-containing protein [Gammaproteobacteria bacterium]